MCVCVCVRACVRVCVWTCKIKNNEWMICPVHKHVRTHTQEMNNNYTSGKWCDMNKTDSLVRQMNVEEVNIESPKRLKKITIAQTVSLWVSVLCLLLASDSSETVQVIIIQFGTVTASDIIMHHVLIILTLTFVQGHTDLNNENKCLIISETVQTMPIKFAVKIVRLKVYMIFSQSDDIAVHSRWHCVSNLTSV